MDVTHHLTAGPRTARRDHTGHGGRYTIDLADDGIIDMHVWGFWEEADGPRFFDLLGAIHVTARAERGRVRQLVSWTRCNRRPSHFMSRPAWPPSASVVIA